MRYVVFKSDDGRIVRECQGLRTNADSRAGQDSWLEVQGDVENVFDHYVTAGRLALKEPQSTTLEATTGQVVVSNIPAAATVYCQGQFEHTTGANVTIEFDLPGDYTISVVTDSPRWLDFEQEVTVP